MLILKIGLYLRRLENFKKANLKMKASMVLL